MSKEMLSLSFKLTTLVKNDCKDTQLFVLYDSLKQSCCTDVLGAQHVNYDGLVHFGFACFSEEYKPNHHYLFDEHEEEIVGLLVNSLKMEENKAFLK